MWLSPARMPKEMHATSLAHHHPPRPPRPPRPPPPPRGHRARRAPRGRGRTGCLVATAACIAVVTGVLAPVASAKERSVGAQAFLLKVTLDGRTRTSMTNHAAPRRYRSGARVLVVCQAHGGVTVHGDTVWDLTSDGLWLPDYRVPTGSRGFPPKLPRCSTPRAFTVAATLDGRTAKKLTNHAYPDRYRRGSSVRISCQAYGGPTYQGSYLWDRATDRLW